MIRRDDNNILKKAMMMEVNGKRKRGRPKLTWRRQVEESRVKDRGNWRLNEIGGRYESNSATFGNEKKSGLELEVMRMELYGVSHSIFHREQLCRNLYYNTCSHLENFLISNTHCLLIKIIFMF